jgi:3-hydroxyisobutyrate dehydrogenase-like beta-hydroxyacid dehydrogenase
LAGSPKGAASGADVAFTILADEDRIAATHRAMGQHFLCAPVFGRPAAAAAAKLFVAAAGDLADFQAATPLLSAMSQRVFYVGEKPSAANLVKLCGNFMVLSAIESLGEAMVLAEKGCAITCCKSLPRKVKTSTAPR